MRWLGRLLLVLILASLALAAMRYWFGEESQLDRAAQQAFSHLAQARALTVYELSAERWTRFGLQTTDSHLRVITNAELKPGAHGSDTRWHYALDYRLVTQAGQVLKQGTYHHRTEVTLFVNPEDGSTYSYAAHFPVALQPADGRVMQINFPETQQADYLELKINSMQKPLERIISRVYQQKNFSDREVGYQWQRMSQQRRKQLGDISVYPVELLKETEQKNILTKRWIRLAPSGTLGTDYFTDKLYVLREHEGQPLEDPVYKAGLMVDRDLKAVIPIPAQGKLRLEISPVATDGLSAQGLIKWYGRPATIQKQWTVSAADGSLEWEADLDQGLLEIDWSAPAYIRAWQHEEEITPSQRYVRAYQADAQQAVTFQISHVQHMPTPLRIDLRSASIDELTVNFKMLSEEGNTIREGNIELQPEPSLFDRVHGNPEERISDPMKRFFSVPPEVQRFTINSNEPVFVSAFSRPPGLPRTIEVIPIPESQVSLPAWFPIRPALYEQLRLKGRSTIIATQQRPPQVDPQILAGQYRWQQYRPTGNWQARYLLTQLQTTTRQRDQLLAGGYRQLDSEDWVTFPSPFGRKEINARLLYQRDQSGPMTIRLYVDDQLHFEKKVFGRSGELQLPPLAAGERKLRVTGNGVFYISSTAQPEWLKRKVFRMDERKHTFVFNKESTNEELLSMRFYGDNPDEHNDRWIEVQLTNLPEHATGPMQNWTYANYRFLVHQNQSASSIILGALDADETDAGQPLFITFGDDMPAGEYLVSVRLVSGNPGYVTFSKTTPGDYSRLELVYAP